MKITKNFGFAIKGILYCLKNERNMRFHLVIFLYVVGFSLFFELTPEKYMTLFLTGSSVFATELLNTAVENLLDLVISDYNSTIKVIKNITAGAVLVTAFFAIINGLTMFLNLKIYIKIYKFFSDFPVFLILLLVSFIFSYFYIFGKKTKN